jgi:dTDP-4-amino-4,6-dideoxygalactose transaminase
MEWRVPLADLNYGETEKQVVLDVIQNQWLTMGKVTQEFEARFADLMAAKHCIAVSNGTVALHLACLALGIGPGDEVILPALTFVASSNAVLHAGAEVRFADILSVNELNISPEKILAQITPNSKAILVVHYGGYSCRMAEIQAIADEHNLAIIEDAAHAPGARLDGKMLGTWGDIGCFSFFSNKNLAVGEGGMVVTNNDDIAEKVRLLRSHAMTSFTWDRHRGFAYSYDVIDLGYNYRIDEIRSALGIVQLEKLPANNTIRKRITGRYWDAFEDSGLGLPYKTTACSSSHHIFPVLLPAGMNKKNFIDFLRQAGVQTSFHYPPIHQFSYYRPRFPDCSLPETEAVARREVTLPLFPSMSDGQVELVIRTTMEALTSLG